MGALAVSQRALAVADREDEFQLHGLRVFNSIPKYHHDVVVLHGMVVVFETDTLGREGVIEGAFYVIERQYPAGGMTWESWLRLENEDPDEGRTAQPRNRLRTSREVVQAIRRLLPSGELRWFYRLPSGFNDGPLYDWAVGMDFVGKVVGIYRS